MIWLAACGFRDGALVQHDAPDTGAPVDTAAGMADTADSEDTADTATEAPIPSVAWTAEGLTLSIENGSVGGYWFGLITATYTGEDCIDHNQDEPTAAGHDKCHEAARDGEMWRTIVVVDEETAERYLHDRNDDYTLFDASHADFITYILMDKRSLACWVWGADPGYYASLSLGCTT